MTGLWPELYCPGKMNKLEERKTITLISHEGLVSSCRFAFACFNAVAFWSILWTSFAFLWCLGYLWYHAFIVCINVPHPDNKKNWFNLTILEKLLCISEEKCAFFGWKLNLRTERSLLRSETTPEFLKSHKINSPPVWHQLTPTAYSSRSVGGNTQHSPFRFW